MKQEKSKNESSMSSQIADMVESVTGKRQDVLEQQQQPVLDLVEFLASKYVKQNSNQPRVAGLDESQVWISDDFNDPIPREYWGGGE